MGATGMATCEIQKLALMGRSYATKEVPLADGGTVIRG